MNKLIHHSFLGAVLCTAISCNAIAADTVNVTLTNSNSQLLVSRICTTTDFKDDDHCTIFDPATNEGTITAKVNLGTERGILAVRAIKDKGNAPTSSSLKINLTPNGSYSIILNDKGELSAK